MNCSYANCSISDSALDKTDSKKYQLPTAVIQNWMRNRDVIEFLGLWERLHNPDFKPLEFEGFKKQAGANAFTMSPKKWIEATDAIGIVSKAGRCMECVFNYFSHYSSNNHKIIFSRRYFSFFIYRNHSIW